MATDVIMPQMGESIAEGTITKWLKKVGEPVKRDEPIFEISTDKVDAEIPSPVAGTLTEILFPEGTTVAINTVVARIGEATAAPGVAVSAPAAQAEVKTETAAAPVQPQEAKPAAAAAPPAPAATPAEKPAIKPVPAPAPAASAPPAGPRPAPAAPQQGGTVESIEARPGPPTSEVVDVLLDLLHQRQ